MRRFVHFYRLDVLLVIVVLKNITARSSLDLPNCERIIADLKYMPCHIFQISKLSLGPEVGRMGGRAQGVVVKRVVKKFIPGWVDLCLDGVRNEIWLESNPKVIGQARCKICKTPDGEKKVIKIAEGYTAIKKHAEGAKHQLHLSKIQKDPNHNFRGLLGQSARNV